MARVIPSEHPREVIEGPHAAEIETLLTLKAALPKDYTVFHSIIWTKAASAPGRERLHFGEVDFVILNGRGGVLLIEQKNGVLEERDGRLFKWYGQVEKEVTVQIDRSIEHLRDKFTAQTKLQLLKIDYLIYCPDHRVTEVLGPHLDRNRVVDASRAKQLAHRIQELLPLTAEEQQPLATVLERFFRQRFCVTPDAHAQSNLNEQSFTRLTGPVIELLSSIEMNPLRLRLKGSAGSGKTLIGMRHLDLALARGERALMVCFNRPLADRLSATAPKGARVDTWHGLVISCLQDLGHKIDVAAAAGDPEFWRRGFMDLLMEQEIPPKWKFDLIVVDEGQDFDPYWSEGLAFFTHEKTGFLWLEDPSQKLYRVKEASLDGFATVTLPYSYRASIKIAEFIQSTLDPEFITMNNAQGFGVKVRRAGSPEEQSTLIAAALEDARRDHIELKDIVVLTMKGRDAVLNGPESFGSFKVSRILPAEAGGVERRTSGDVLFESVRRYKGQQAAAVILIDVDWLGPTVQAERREELERLLLCGASRAILRLDVVCTGAIPPGCKPL